MRFRASTFLLAHHAPQRHRGATLVELLVAVGIIGILSSIVILAINPTKQFCDAQNAVRQSNEFALTKSLQKYLLIRQWNQNAMIMSVPANVAYARPICNSGITGAPNCINLDAMVTEKFAPTIPVDEVEVNPNLTGYGVYRDTQGKWYAKSLHFNEECDENEIVSDDDDYGTVWTPIGPNRTWRDVAVSGDGRRMVAVVYGGQIYTSEDYGLTWTARETVRYWMGVAMSTDGTIITAVAMSGQIYTSADYGLTWTARENTRDWQNVAMSIDGSKQTAVAYDGKIYTSSNYGATWVERADDQNRNWINIAMSDDGTYQTAVTETDGYIFTSDNAGLTWNQREGGSTYQWKSVAISGNGQFQTAASSNTKNIYTSNNFGVEWFPKDTLRDWKSVALSSNGTYQTALVLNVSDIFTSKDQGTQWSPNPAVTNTWHAVAMSRDAKVQAAVGYASTPIYISHD